MLLRYKRADMHFREVSSDINIPVFFRNYYNFSGCSLRNRRWRSLYESQTGLLESEALQKSESEKFHCRRGSDQNKGAASRFQVCNMLKRPTS